MSEKVFLATLIILILLPSLTSANVFTENSAEFQKVIKQLDMQGHSGDELSTCQVKQIYHTEVVEMLNNGMSEKEIIQSYVDEYGQAALRTPATDKKGLIAWGMPFAGLGAGIAFLAFWLKRVKSYSTEGNEDIQGKWASETEKEMLEKTFEEERKKQF